MHISQIHYYQTKIEKGFNIAGTIPLLGIPAGALRILTGTVQAVAASIITAIGAAGHKMATFSSCSEKTIERWKAVKLEGAEQAIHGVLNILNGFGEIAEHSLGFLGIFLQINQNVREKRHFEPKFEYGFLGKRDYQEI